MITFPFSYYFEYSYSSSCPLYLGNLIMYPTCQISLVVLSISYTLPWVISMLCSLFKESTQCLIYNLIPSLLYLLCIVSPFFCSVPSHSCDPLEDLLPSLSQHGSISVLPDDEDLEFWWSYLRIHFPHWCIPLLQLSIITYWSTNCWILSMFDFSLPLFTWLGLYWFFGILSEDLSPHRDFT